MSSYSLPPLDLSEPLSKRAVQLLRELQGLKLLDEGGANSLGGESLSRPDPKGSRHEFTDRVEPVMGKDPVKVFEKGGAKPASKRAWGKVAFSRENYLNDVRSSLLGSMVLAVFTLCIVLGAAIFVTTSFLLPSLEDLQQQAETIRRLPADLKSTNEQIEAQTNRRQEVTAQLDSLVKYFPNPYQAYSSYGGFLTVLEGHKVAVTSQKGGVTQTPANPLLADAMGNADARKRSEQNSGTNPKAANAPAPKMSTLSGDMKPGLNYYHLAFTLEGSYVGYLSARQTLVNENPNLVVHSETVATLKDRSSDLEITSYISIPFIYKP